MVSLSHPTRRVGDRHKIPVRGLGWTPAENRFGAFTLAPHSAPHSADFGEVKTAIINIVNIYKLHEWSFFLEDTPVSFVIIPLKK